MRILVLADVPPSVVGGAQVQALRLAKRWAADGHQVLIAGTENRSWEGSALSVVRIPLLRQTRLLRGVSYTLATLWLLWARRRDYDLIYCRFLAEQAFSAALARMILRLPQPLVACPACSGSMGEAARISRSRYRRLLLAVFNRGISCVNAMSQRIEAEIRTLGLDSPMFAALPNGVNVPATFRQRASQDSVPLAIFVGRLVVQKGLDILFQALGIIAKEKLKLKLVLVGDGPMRQDLETLADTMGLTETIAFLGALPPESIPTQLRKADLFVLPSRDEGMPGALLEAIASGLPAVVTSCGGAEDIVDDSIGWVVPPGDPQALGAALISAITAGPNALREMGNRAYHKAQVNYEIGQVAQRHLELFSHLFSESHQV